MGIMTWLGIGKEIAEPIKAVGDLYTTDKARIAAETEFQKAMIQPVMGQLDINKALALSASIFTSGWQPLIGWTAGFLIFLYWGPQLCCANYIWIKQCLIAKTLIPFPIKPDDIMHLIYLVFGFGGYTLVNGKIN